MTFDYYLILGIPPSASAKQIKNAYRDKALRYHPDRGGSHEKMVAINEAFSVLSNPELRRQYDYARTHKANYSAQQRAAENSYKAHQSAEYYPRNWEDFSVWLENIAQDFKNAEYSTTKNHKYPTVDRSITGWLFIIGGGIVGFIFAHASGRFYLFAPYIVIGAWIGRWLHEYLGSVL